MFCFAAFLRHLRESTLKIAIVPHP